MMSTETAQATGAAAPRSGSGALQSRSARKRRAILDAATDAFVSLGFDATSMDDVARAASVSKPTIYNHFGDKESLFRAAILAAIEYTEANTHEMIAALPRTQDLRRDLQRFARQHLADLMEPSLIRMRRRIIAEAERFPDLASTWYDHGPATAVATLALVLAELAERGLLRVDDPTKAAEQFNWLVLIPLNRAMFLARQFPDQDDLDRAADDAVQVFLTIYAPHQGS